MIFKHLKTGNLYRFDQLAVNEADNVPVVLYSGIYSEKTWVRPAAEFFDGRFEPYHVMDDHSSAEEVEEMRAAVDEQFLAQVAREDYDATFEEPLVLSTEEAVPIETTIDELEEALRDDEGDDGLQGSFASVRPLDENPNPPMDVEPDPVKERLAALRARNEDTPATLKGNS